MIGQLVELLLYLQSLGEAELVENRHGSLPVG
jgi:hypothetical protein